MKRFLKHITMLQPQYNYLLERPDSGPCFGHAFTLVASSSMGLLRLSWTIVRVPRPGTFTLSPPPTSLTLPHRQHAMIHFGTVSSIQSNTRTTLGSGFFSLRRRARSLSRPVATAFHTRAIRNRDKEMLRDCVSEIG